MKATLTSKGQITIPLAVRKKLHLKLGDELEFDEDAPYLRAVRVIAPAVWDQCREAWSDPWGSKTSDAILDELRGPTELPHA